MKRLLIGLTAVVLAVTGLSSLKVSAVSDDPEEVIMDYISRVQLGDLDAIYEESFGVIKHMNDQETYNAKLIEVYGDLEEVQYKKFGSAYGARYDLYSNNKKISTLKVFGDSVASIFEEQKDYTIEIPAGSKLSVNGTEVGGGYLVEEGTTPTNLNDCGSVNVALKVDRYFLEGMLGTPEITVDGKKVAVMKDVLSDTYYVGEDITDDTDLANTILYDAETMAKWPARDAGIGSVANFAITDSTWYRRVAEVQNDWFTAHGVAQFSNEKVLKIVKQDEDLVVANVVFDYFTSNGEVQRNWICGYQMTLVNVGGYWKVATIRVDSSLNPDSPYYNK